MKTVIFYIQGGIGKHIAATAVAENISKNFLDRKLIVLCQYPEIFLNNPNIYRVYKSSSSQYFYEDFIKNKDTIFLGHEAYNANEYIVENKHLIESWCNMFNLKYSGENPMIYINQAEYFDAKNKYTREKPILILQTQGGGEGNSNYNWARDLPQDLVIDLISNLKNKYHIYHIKRPEHATYKDVEPVYSNIREVISLLLLSDKRLLIDSFVQHACAALRLESVVCWITTKPEKLGYNIHKNILPQKESLIYSHNLESITAEKEFIGIPHQCNINLNKLFNKQEIIKNF